jgi:pimeloyl-ACP methyl ester carboxylesterase
MAATATHVVSEFQRRAPGGDLRPLLASVKTPTLVLAAARLREEVMGDFRGVADLFPNGRLVVFPGVSGFVQHVLPVPCARAWLDFAASLGAYQPS